MAKPDVQDPARIGTVGVEELFFELLPEIPVAVRYTYQKLGYHPDPSIIEDLVQRIILLLLSHEYKALRSYDRRALPKTWLSAVVRNFVKRDLRHHLEKISLEDLPEHSLLYPPKQDSELESLDHQLIVKEALKKLTLREIKLFQLLCEDSVPQAEIARVMGIQVSSLYSYKYNLIKKLRILITSMRVCGSGPA
jgi:RNA polymerase sigma factor (sigma-70 family)